MVGRHCAQIYLLCVFFFTVDWKRFYHHRKTPMVDHRIVIIFLDLSIDWSILTTLHPATTGTIRVDLSLNNKPITHLSISFYRGPQTNWKFALFMLFTRQSPRVVFLIFINPLQLSDDYSIQSWPVIVFAQLAAHRATLVKTVTIIVIHRRGP